MDITIFHFGALFFGSMTIFNVYSARKYGESYLPAIIAAMMFISFSMLLILPLQYGSVAFMFIMMFGVVNYKKAYRINRKKMERYIGDSRSTEPLKFADYFTGWKVLHRLNAKYGPVKTSLINSAFMWLFGILLLIIFSYLWPDIYPNLRYMSFVMTVVVTGFYWQNKKLLENLDIGNVQQVKKK